MTSKQITLGYLAELVGGTLFGDPQQQVDGAAPLYEVGQGQVTLLDSDRVPESLATTNLAGIIVKKRVEGLPLAQIEVAQPRQAFTQIVTLFLPPDAPIASGVSPHARIDQTATIGHGVSIATGVVVGRNVSIGDRCRLMPGVVIMDHSQIGDDCVIFPNVTIYERSIVGERVTIHAGTVIGAYGFGYYQQEGCHIRAPQLGNVVLDDDVEIGACVTIDRGTYGSTRIGCGTKVDNQVMIGHNCQIGRHNLLCSQVGIAGSCTTGDYVVLAGQVGLKDHVSLGDAAIVGAQSGVMDDLPGGQVYLGSPATPQREQMQIMAVQRKLPEMRRALKDLQRGPRGTAVDTASMGPQSCGTSGDKTEQEGNDPSVDSRCSSDDQCAA